MKKNSLIKIFFIAILNLFLEFGLFSIKKIIYPKIKRNKYIERNVPEEKRKIHL
jgi:hypothetical protein